MKVFFLAKVGVTGQAFDRIQLPLRVYVFFGLNVLTFIENQCLNMCYEIITK